MEKYLFHIWNENMSQIAFCCTIAFIYTVQVWIINAANFQKYTSNYWFYCGSSLESIRAFLYNSRLKWQNMMVTFFFLNFLLFANFYRINENNEVTLFQIFFPFIISNVMPFFSYLYEKKFRIIFEENIDNQSNKLKYFEVLIKNILPDQVIIMNLHDKQLIFCNDEAKKFNGSNDMNIILQKLKNDYIDCEKEENIIEHIFMKQNISNESFYNFQAKRMDHETKEIFYFDVKTQRIDWQDDDSLLILLHDITAIKNLEKMKEIDAYKDQLLANVSHDLRTPLYGIMGILENVLDQIKDKILESEVHLALNCSNLLLFMINDILDYSQLNKGQLSIRLIKTSIQNIVEEISSLIKFQAKKKGLKFSINITKNLIHFNLITDPRRLQQILLNLLSNALKFTIKGEITLTITEENSCIKFAVSDTGIGISEQAQKKLFNLYSKINTGPINKEGIGLGLVISKNLLNLICKRDIKVRSQVGVGSIFEFEIPIEQQDSDDVGEEHVEGDRIYKRFELYSNLKKKKKEKEKIKKVLIVEDDQICILVISR